MVNEELSNPVERVRKRLTTRVAPPATAKPIADVLASYKIYLADLRKEDMESSEILLVLITRDEIEQRWAELSPQQQRHVERLDATLAIHYAKVAAVLPNALSTDRARWWWFLHEGPQVRAEAKGVA
ncbi:MAG: hypothetical protein HY689_06355 [Chloroflexi bacterium]|nr:hypothetical protein [Chloroflexota bacterium]